MDVNRSTIQTNTPTNLQITTWRWAFTKGITFQLKWAVLRTHGGVAVVDVNSINEQIEPGAGTHVDQCQRLFDPTLHLRQSRGEHCRSSNLVCLEPADRHDGQEFITMRKHERPKRLHYIAR